MRKDVINENNRKEETRGMIKTDMEHKASIPLVSVIIPVYNAECYIKQCVDSILEQTYENIEVICIDDGSEDSTSAILQFLARKDKRVIVLNQQHLGVSAARNKGMKFAKGKYISFVEADDYIENESYEILVQNAEEKNVDIVIFGSNIIGENLEKSSTETPQNPGYYNGNKVMNVFFDESEARSLYTCFFRKNVLSNGNGIKFNEKMDYGEDKLFLFEVVPQVENVSVVNNVIYNHRFSSQGSVTRYYIEDIRKYFQSQLSLAAQIADSWKNNGMFEKAEDKFVTWLIHEEYNYINELPSGIRNWAAWEVIKLIEELDLKYYCIDWREKAHFDEIVKMAEICKERGLDDDNTGITEKLFSEISLNNSEPLVSVIVPTYNVDEYIKQCIDSLLDQTYKNIEVICVDDGSSDNTIPILKFIQEKDDRLKLIQQEHAGVSAARNKGLDAARGKYISFVDSDDFIQWNSYEILVSVAEKFHLDLIIFGGNAIGEAPKWIQNKLNTRYKYYEKGTAKKVVFEEESARPFLWLHFIRRDIIERGDKLRFNETMEMGEDQLFQFEYVPRAESVMVLEDKLYNYRIGRNCSLMQLYEKQKMKKFDSHILLISNVIESWKKRGLFYENEDRLITWMVNLTYWSLIFFPKAFQPELAKKVVDLVKKYDIKEYCIAWYEKEHWDYMKEIAEKEIDLEEEIRELKEKIAQDKYQIREILKSKAFRLGRLTTKKRERIDLNKIM